MAIDVKFVRLKPNAKIPTQGSVRAAGYDLYACTEGAITILPHETVKVGTGLAIQPPAGYWGAIVARSGLATKQGLRPANCIGMCDEDYTGEYIVALHNDSNEKQTINHGDRIAQLTFIPYITVNFKESESLDETARGAGGFGSTGTN